MNIHREVEPRLDRLHRVAVELIGFVDALCVPVSPVEHILKDCDRKRVWKTCRQPAIFEFVTLLLNLSNIVLPLVTDLPHRADDRVRSSPHVNST